jgi:hypothetical protein
VISFIAVPVESWNRADTCRANIHRYLNRS